MPRLAGARGHRDHARGDTCLKPRADLRMPRRVVVAGASGLIGSALVDSLRADGVAGHDTRAPRRGDAGRGRVAHRPRRRSTPRVLEGADAVVGLNGASIGRFPWTAALQAHAAVVADHAHPGARARGARSSATTLPRSSRRPPSGITGRRPAAAHRRFAEGRDVPRRSVRRVGGGRAGGRRLERGSALVRTAPIVPPRGVLKPADAADPAGRERTDRARHAGVAMDLARRRGRGHPSRHRSDVAGPVNLWDRPGDCERSRLRPRRADEPPVPGAGAGVGDEARPRHGCDRGDPDDGHGRRSGGARGSGFAFSHPTVEEAVAAAVPAAGRHRRQGLRRVRPADSRPDRASRTAARARRRSPAASYARPSRYHARQSSGCASTSARYAGNAASASSRSTRPLGRTATGSWREPALRLEPARRAARARTPNHSSRPSAHAAITGRTNRASSHRDADGLAADHSSQARWATSTMYSASSTAMRATPMRALMRRCARRDLTRDAALFSGAVAPRRPHGRIRRPMSRKLSSPTITPFASRAVSRRQPDAGGEAVPGRRVVDE